MAAVPAEFDVFLNHRGTDVKGSFAAHLHQALQEAGCRPFLDTLDLEKGQAGQEKIYEALGCASVHVAIFSKHYASSHYCLDELCAMLESQKLIIPVFYNVSPSVLRCEADDGPYTEALKRHRVSASKVKKWKYALRMAAELNGFKLDDYNRDEARLKTAIVSKVREHLPASQLLLEDFYLLLGLTTSGPEVPQAAIRKAYRVRALLCHPDKRGDDPVAAAEFVSLQRAYDVLGDEQARAAYDELLRLQKERLQKENHLSAKRQKMMQDLHDRENAHEIEKKAKVVEEQAAARLKVEIARIRKQRAQQQEKVPLFSDNRNLSVPSPGTAHHIDASDIDKTIKVTWACLEGGSGGYSAEQLKDIFKEFGEVEDIVIRQGKSRRKSSALLVMGSKEAAIAATQRPCGDISNPLLAVPATVTTGAASVTSEQLHPMAASQPTTRVSNGLVGASYRSFEDATLLKMRQIAKEGSSAATASTDDKCSSYLNSMSVRNKYKYSQPFDVSEDCADSDLRSTLSNSTEFSDHTAATALGLSSQRSNFSKDQDSRNTPWKGLQYSDDQMKWIASIVPDQWKGCLHIHLGAYNTKEAAARAYDVGNYYTKKSFAFNISSPAAFLPPFPNNLSLDKAEDRIAIREFVQKEAKNFVAMIEKAKAPS